MMKVAGLLLAYLLVWEEGGFYMGLSWIMWQTTSPILLFQLWPNEAELFALLGEIFHQI